MDDQSCPTVTIQTDNGPVIINESDYDPKEHKLAKGEATPPVPVEPPADAPPPPAPPVVDPTPLPPADAPAPANAPVTAPVAPRPVSPGIIKDGSKHFIVDMNNDNERIGDIKGYPSNAKATEAAQALTK